MVETQTRQNTFWLWSDVVNFTRRGDFDFWSPEYVKNDELMSQYSLFDDVVEDITNGVELRRYSDKGELYLKVGNIKEFFTDLDDIKLVPLTREAIKAREKVVLSEQDILMSRSGSLGIITVVTPDIKNSIISSHIMRLCVKKEFSPYYIATFLNGSFGKNQILRRRNGSPVPEINHQSLEEIRFFIPSKSTQQKVEQIVKEAFKLKKEAEAEYQKSQQLLNEALGLTGIEQKLELAFWRWSNEVDIVARIDPDYYRKGYIQLAKAKSVKAEPLSKFVVSYSGGYTFETEKYLSNGIPIIRIKDLNYLEVKKPEDAFFADLPELQHFTAKPDDILISMSGTVGLSAIIPKELQKCYINQRITAITTRGIDKFYLLVFLNSPFYREELEKVGTGGVQTNVSYKLIVSLPILRLGDKEEIIGNLLRRFIDKNKKSKQKLQEAKDFVENLVRKNSE